MKFRTLVVYPTMDVQLKYAIFSN